MQLQEDKPYDDINITPMLDLAYVLLVIFIIMTTAAVQGVKVNLPKASNQPSLAKPKTVAITIAGDGKVFMDAVPVTMAELSERLRQKKAQIPDLPVVVRGDTTAQYGNVVQVLALLSELGITQLGLVTQRLVQ
ncbi:MULTISPECIES: ExbD/TolR family protein [Hydrocarboniphaga]|jgi:biopolymer transport protein ExbD|uniref:Biopolymer transport protein ExbD/TolR n=1 Tax=Hydrocarboniphaga effusa AP103 TaxID=1172194 RepID=I8I0B9_9GAMM|nr:MULTISPECIES: biopolymer transporter ExbD [Hydrocarboniphaga]EIT69431.1 biopolymer transport protein ExbD/TolR [Hydrocarboniphaga effusa AP103]MDZ4079223.1 biopolymer transporter ExbD [Hydrocarboniphaga sp.]